MCPSLAHFLPMDMTESTGKWPMYIPESFSECARTILDAVPNVQNWAFFQPIFDNFMAIFGICPMR